MILFDGTAVLHLQDHAGIKCLELSLDLVLGFRGTLGAIYTLSTSVYKRERHTYTQTDPTRNN